MNKKNIVIVLLVILILISATLSGIYYNSYRNYLLNSNIVPALTQTNDESTSTPISTTSTDIRVPVDQFTLIKNSVRFDAAPFVNPQTGDKIVFQGTPDDSQNPSYNVLVNNKTIDQVSGQEIGTIGFSTDNNYFAYEGRSTTGAGLSLFDTEIISINPSALSYIPPPKKSEDFTGDTSQYYYKQATSYISPIKWINQHTLQLSFFYLDQEKNTGIVFRISPIEIWNYDPVTAQYTFVEQLPN